MADWKVKLKDTGSITISDVDIVEYALDGEIGPLRFYAIVDADAALDDDKHALLAIFSEGAWESAFDVTGRKNFRPDRLRAGKKARREVWADGMYLHLNLLTGEVECVSVDGRNADLTSAQYLAEDWEYLD